MISSSLPHEPGTSPPDGALDRAAIATLYEDLGAEIVNEILLTAVGDIERHGGALLGCADGEPEGIRRSAHALAGVSAAIGAVELTALARKVERACAIGGEREALQAALGRAATELAAVAAAHGASA